MASSHVLAIKALRAVSKSSATSLQLDHTPSELLIGDILDFSQWSLIMTDECLKILSAQSRIEKRYLLDIAANNLADIFSTFNNAYIFNNGVVRLNLTNAKNITDLGLVYIARKNPNISHLNLSGCVSITDDGLREIGINCTNLQDLNISLCPGIKGSGLVSVAECCRFLSKLNVSKCKSLEKWAITKIFYHCNQLEDVNISYYKDITDEEIRVLAQNCPNIMTFHAMECQYLSDQTIIMISEHCKDIDFIDMSRTTMTYRISDVCLLALSQHSLSLKILRLNGCDQISDVGLTWLSDGCHAIEELDFGKCPLITDAGLRGIGKNCHSLTSLNISHSRTVTDIGICSISTGCPNLRTLNCHGMFLLSDPRLSIPKKGAKLEAWQSLIGIAALAKNCPNIEELDLSGCFRLNVALSEYVASFTSLKTLNIAGCNQVVTESLISIAKSCPLIQELILMDVGKAVNHFSIQSFSKSCINLTFLNLTRCEHVNGACIKAISQLKNLKKLDLTGCKILNDTMLVYLSEINKVPLLHTLILVDLPLITDSILAWLSIKQPQNLYYLGLKGTFITKKAIISVKDQFINSDIVTNEAFYGFLPKYRVKDLNKRLTSVLKIQRKFRSRRTKKLVSAAQQVRKYKLRCVVSIQSLIRGFIARLLFATLKIDALELKQLKAVVVIQTMIRMRKARQVLKLRKIEYNNLLNCYDNAGFIINHAIRMKLARMKVKQMKGAYLERMRQQAIKEMNAIIMIQAHYRGNKGRKLYQKKLREKKGKWKELYDEKKRKRFFYNKLTGEIRWRLPQDLLDLVPHPICDNCSHLEALLECSVCNEMYCKTCWDQVHFGGRRKHHEFRSLYDYYGKRLDYGDGIFPSKWPSEVIQDEVQGWMLRVAPMRIPIAKYKNGWEEYHDNLHDTQYTHSHHIHDKIPSFYFNRQTFEATYEIPEEILQEKSYKDSKSRLKSRSNNTNNNSLAIEYEDSYLNSWNHSYNISRGLSSYNQSNEISNVEQIISSHSVELGSNSLLYHAEQNYNYNNYDVQQQNDLLRIGYNFSVDNVSNDYNNYNNNNNNNIDANNDTNDDNSSSYEASSVQTFDRYQEEDGMIVLANPSRKSNKNTIAAFDRTFYLSN
eukprot:gene9683-13036_t